ncbi:MAG: hypothetical protein JSV04_06370 [Candidatus Heimdallarchaeota archaeon]|nr:MAG: hypothetical protein JSV04_06370 [Candidatus Heimdallarchaeota archaeon]
MVRLKAVYIITEEGFVIYNQSFGVTEQDQDMVGSLLMALRSFGKEVLREGSLSKVDFGEGADMILEAGNRIIAIVVVVLDKDHKEREEYDIRNDLLKFVKRIEERYSEELDDPIFQKSSFSGIGTQIYQHFFRDKMSRIHNNQFASLNEYLNYPTTLLFEITPRGGKLYQFYREFPKFTDVIGDIQKEEFDNLVATMQDKNSMVSFKDCLDLFGEQRGDQILEIFKFLTNRGMFEAYNFERIAVESESG